MAVVTRSQDRGERLGAASQRPSLRRHFRLNLRNTGVESEVRPSRRGLRLAKPTLKFTLRRTGVVQERARVRTDLVQQLCQAR